MNLEKKVLLIVFIVTSIIPIYAQQYDNEKDFQVKVIGGGKGVEIAKYIGKKKEVSIPPSIQNKPVTSIGEKAFSDCTGLANVTIPDGVTSIEYGAFSNCTSLASVTIPNSVTSIGEGAFYGCTILTSVTIPTNIKYINFSKINFGVFANCNKLTEIIINKNNPSYTSINGIVYDKNKNYLLFCPIGITGKIIIPEGVQYIEYYSFYGCNNITEVVIPESIKKIGPWAFGNCINLVDINIPSHLKPIVDDVVVGYSAFCNTNLNPKIREEILKRFGDVFVADGK